MRVTCPACAAIYEIPASLLDDGPAILRCARCGREWAPADLHRNVLSGSERNNPPAELSAPRPLLPTRPSEPAKPPGAPPDAALPDEIIPGHIWHGAGAVIAGWALTCVLLVAASAAAYTWRSDIERAWPPSQRAYAAIGLTK